MSLRRLIYTSEASHSMTDRQLLDLLHEARGFNAVDGITGLLLHKGGVFFQVLEGEPDALNDLWERLGRDRRHKAPLIIDDQMVDARLFAGWSMESAQLDKPELEGLPGFGTDLRDPERVKVLIGLLPELAVWLRRHLAGG